jgi:hypothetical protein
MQCRNKCLGCTVRLIVSLNYYKLSEWFSDEDAALNCFVTGLTYFEISWYQHVDMWNWGNFFFTNKCTLDMT